MECSKLIFLAIWLLHTNLAIAEEVAVCDQPMEVGNCRGIVPRYYYNATVDECLRFVYGGCNGNDNNFGSFDECRKKCMPGSEKPEPKDKDAGNEDNASNEDNAGNEKNADKEDDNEDMSTVLLLTEKLEREQVDFEDADFGEWIASEMEIIALNDTKNNQTNNVVQPTYLMTEPEKEGVLNRTIDMAPDKHFELDLDVLVVNYVAANAASLAKTNPGLSVGIVDDNSSVSVFQIDDFADFFANQTDWVTLRLVLPISERLEGQRALEIRCRQGNEANSTVMLDNLVLTTNRRLRPKIDSDDSQTTTSPPTTTTPITTTTSSTDNSTISTDTTTTTKSDDSTTTTIKTTTTTTTTTEPPVLKAGDDNTVELVLVCIIVLLLVAIVVLSIKYWKLRQETFGTYNIKATPTEPGSFDNPMYGGHSAPNYPDRFGVLRD